MQRRITLVMVLIGFLVSSLQAVGAEGSLQSARQLSNEVYRLSQDMIFHGAEGHTDEIVSYGKKMLERAEKLKRQIEALPAPEKRADMEKAGAALKNAIKKATEAIELGEQNQGKEALAAARKASFHAKQARQRLQSLK